MTMRSMHYDWHHQDRHRRRRCILEARGLWSMRLPHAMYRNFALSPRRRAHFFKNDALASAPRTFFAYCFDCARVSEEEDDGVGGADFFHHMTVRCMSSPGDSSSPTLVQGQLKKPALFITPSPPFPSGRRRRMVLPFPFPQDKGGCSFPSLSLRRRRRRGRRFLPFP